MENTDMIQRKLSAGAVLFLLLFISFSASAQRESRTINDGWRFFQGDCSEGATLSWDDSRWASVHLPHTWNTDAYVEKDYYRGRGWYRRVLDIPASWKDKQVFLKLDAASKVADVYLNGQPIGSHAGGYTACIFDLTEYLSFTTPNLLAVRVDNARQDVPPVSADFTFFGGIYRDVWLTAVPYQHFTLTDCGSDGLFIHTSCLSDKQGSVFIRGGIRNDDSVKAVLELICSVYHPDGTLAQQQKKKIQVKAGETYVFQEETAPIHCPELWTPEIPVLYRVETVLRDASTKVVLDRMEHYTAFRYFHFDAQKGFFLNGKPYKLRGICRHQDQKPIGVALSDEMHRRDFRLMKEMGANFIRISHYPQDDALLEMCDHLGMLVWEEIPIINRVPDTPGFADHCEQNLREMIRQHYNHPSVIAWGYMNEILLETQRIYKTEDMLKLALERTLALAERLERVLKEEDSTRVSVMAFHGSNAYNESGLNRIVDVVGWNLYNGWYGGDLKGFDRFLAEQQQDYSTHPLIVSEYGAGSDKRLHTTAPRPFDFSSEYQQTYLEHYLPVLENTPYVCGGAHWNFTDFSSAVREESMPRINNKGLVRADRAPKDVYYYYQAMWRKDIPVLHIASRDWNVRCGIQGAPDASVMLPVKVYTNLPEVELSIDGRLVGRKSVTNCHAVFEVPFEGTEPYLSVTGVFDGREVHDGLRVNFTPIPLHIADADWTSLELAVNVGSNCFFTSDKSGLTWVPDRPYIEGGWGYIGGREKSTQTEIQLTVDDPLYQTMREDIEEYRFDVPTGSYEVELLFADPDGVVTSPVYLLGKSEESIGKQGNVFTVSIDGRIVEENLTPARDAGSFHAVKRRYVVSHKGGSLKVAFGCRQGKTYLSGIKLRKL